MNYLVSTATDNATENESFAPYATLEAAYGQGLGLLYTQATLEAITLIGLCLCNENKPSRVIHLGGFYSNLLSFSTFSQVITDDSLTRTDLLNLLRYLAETL